MPGSGYCGCSTRRTPGLIPLNNLSTRYAERGAVMIRPNEVQLSPARRDKMILELRKRGYTYRAIAKHVGMSPNGVMHAWRRLAAGGKGTRARY